MSSNIFQEEKFKIFTITDYENLEIIDSLTTSGLRLYSLEEEGDKLLRHRIFKQKMKKCNSLNILEDICSIILDNKDYEGRLFAIQTNEADYLISLSRKILDLDKRYPNTKLNELGKFKSSMKLLDDAYCDDGIKINILNLNKKRLCDVSFSNDLNKKGE